MLIDTGTAVRPLTISGLVDEGSRLDFRNFARCEQMARKVAANVYACDSAADLATYERDEALVIDGLFLAWPELCAPIADALDTQRACLAPRAQPSAQAVPQPAVPASPPAHHGNPTRTTTMNAFASFDTGSSGSDGPWIAWSARGTTDGSIPAKSFFLRDGTTKTLFEGFASGVVLDVVNMKTGWQRSEGIAGTAPDWRWNKSLDRFEPAPGDDYKKGFQIKCAIGGGLTATWEQAGAAAWNGFIGLVPALKDAPAGDMLPLVKLTGTKFQQFKRGNTNEPILEIVKWVPRPACLKEGFTAMATDPAPAAQTAPKPAAAPVEMAETADEF